MLDYLKKESLREGVKIETVNADINNFKARYEICVNLLREELNSIRGKRVLDVGCGDGVLSFLLHKAGAEVRGIDSSRSYL